MIATIDYQGIAAVIAAVGALITAVLAYLQRKPVSEVHAAVTTPPDAQTLGVIAGDVQETVNAVKDIVNGKPAP